MKNVGFTAEFNVKVCENPRLDAIAEDAWQADPQCLVVQKFLTLIAGITLAQVTAT
jgi:hypothetical protein